MLSARMRYSAVLLFTASRRVGLDSPEWTKHRSGLGRGKQVFFFFLPYLAIYFFLPKPLLLHICNCWESNLEMVSTLRLKGFICPELTGYYLNVH